MIVPSQIFRMVDSATPVRCDTSSNEALGSPVIALTTLSYRKTLISMLLTMPVTVSFFKWDVFVKLSRRHRSCVRRRRLAPWGCDGQVPRQASCFD